MAPRDPFIDTAMSAGNYSLAVQLIDKKIRKYPNSSYFYALRSEALALQDDKKDKALTEACNLLNKCPSDSDTLSTLIRVFELCDYEPEKDVFEAASKKYPSFDLVYEWFSHSVKNGDILQLQKSAMLLTKAVRPSTLQSQGAYSARKIQFWAASGFLLACKCCKNRLSTANARLYPMLGLKLCQQAVPQTAQQFYVFCELLILVGKHSECLQVLEEFLKKENDLELKLMYLNLLCKSEKYDKLLTTSRHYLVDLKEDDWDTWKWLLIAASHLNRLPECVKLIDDYPNGRNKYLAYLEAFKYDSSLSRETYLKQYITKYGSKKCCFLDLKQFITRKDEVLDKVLEDVYESTSGSVLGDSDLASDDDLLLVVNYMKLKLYSHPEIMHCKQFLEQCCQLYASSCHLLSNLQEFDFSASFELIIMASQAMLVQSTSSQQDVYMHIIVILESALATNPYEFHIKLWLIALYVKVNLVSRAESLFESLKVKFVQLDTLAHILVTRCSSLTLKDTLLNNVESFYSKNVAAEVPHLIFNCFQNLSLSKLEGFFQFEIRLESSFTKYLNTLERIRLCRLENDDRSIESKLKIEIRRFYKIYRKHGRDIDQKVNDNRDLTTFWDCGMHEKCDEAAAVLDRVNPVVDMDYLALQCVANLLVYDSKSALYEEYRAEFARLYKKAVSGSDSTFTEAEKWSLSVIAHVLDSEISIRNTPTLPESTLNFNFNHTLFVMVDTLKLVEHMAKTKRPGAASTKKTLVSLIPREDPAAYKRMSRKDVSKAEEETRKWFKKDPIGKLFNADARVLVKTFEEVRQSAKKSMSALNKV
ncbi:hypothetical protein FOA43_001313 [Brettanomyces nanus]|uniref:Uncharacterized protein n=1 Tax=Eeniella nana TaxID=13502 RepID=A0A875RY08_EENNA|nr:uncharacterized protein FOA43_001313 [Brettanomyces nanus]QPG73996.1 hypothetical protein FOA43_001313 [Brettanomyces nanus]